MYVCNYCNTLSRDPRSALFPYTTLFRSRTGRLLAGDGERGIEGVEEAVRREQLVAVGRAHREQCGNRELGRTTYGNKLRSEEHTSELQSLRHLVCRLLLEKKNHAA